jgi:hypothetical protein
MGSKPQTAAKKINLSKKRELGQFYTTNYNYILEGMSIPKGVDLIETFVGAGDLCLWVETNGHNPLDVECYDFAPPAKLKTNFLIKVRDTLLNPPSYDGKYIITNPPFLARNKAKQTSYGAIFDKWETNDLYKCFLESVISQDPAGGVVILPLNFFCDDRKVETRARFLEKFTITRLNIFEETVFSDTTYTVCSVQFKKRKKKISDTVKVDAHIYPCRNKISLCLSKQTKWKVGAEVLEKQISKYKISRLVHTMVNDKSVRDKTLNPQKQNKITNILLNCVDGGKMDSRIRMEWNPVPLLAKDTDRAFCTLIVDPPISEKKQKKLIDKFNKMLEDYREKYNSLFLVNYRNSSKSYARKRISFDIAFNLAKKCLEQI